MRYLLTFNPKEFGKKRQSNLLGKSKDLRRSTEEERLNRKQEHYKILADRQIEDILHTLLSVSVKVDNVEKSSDNGMSNVLGESTSHVSSNLNDSALDDSESDIDEDTLFLHKMNEWTNLYQP